jgi:hypothetical protein
MIKTLIGLMFLVIDCLYYFIPFTELMFSSHRLLLVMLNQMCILLLYFIYVICLYDTSSCV